MVASRIGLTGACCSARFWLSAFCAVLTPTSIGYQDIAALVGREPAAPTRWHLIASPVQRRDFYFPRPVAPGDPGPAGFSTHQSQPAFAWRFLGEDGGGDYWAGGAEDQKPEGRPPPKRGWDAEN